MAIPKTLSDLSVEFFSSILNCPVASFTLDPPDAQPTQGNTSHLHSLTVNFSSNLTFPPRRLFLKFALSVDDSASSAASFTRQSLIDCGVYRKEIAFYQYAIKSPSLCVMVPPVYYAEIEPVQDHFLLVMGEAGSPLNQLLGCPIDTSRAIISQLAHFHSYFVTEFNAQPSALQVCYTPSHRLLGQVIAPQLNTPQDLLEYSLEHFESKFNDFCVVARAMSNDDQDISAMLKQMSSRFTDKSIFSDLRIAFTHNLLNPKIKTLIHGDFRLDNILEDHSHANSIKFIDFQALHCGHPAYDLAQFIVQCHDNSHLLFNDFLSIYYNTLCELDPRVAQLITMDDLMVSVKSAVIFQLLLLSFHLAPLKSLIDPQTKALPASMDRFMDLIALINKRALVSYINL